MNNSEVQVNSDDVASEMKRITVGKDHIHKYTETIVEATCVSQGYTLHRCECGDEYRDNYTEKVSHLSRLFGDPIVPTCTEPGIWKFKCEHCGEISEYKKEARGHEFGEWHKTMDGREMYKERVCERCGESERKRIFMPKRITPLGMVISTIFWLAIAFCLFGAIFMYDGGSFGEVLRFISPYGRITETQPALLFALNTFSICIGIAFILSLTLYLICVIARSCNLGFPLIVLIGLYVGMWYAGYGLCNLFVLIGKGFYFWTVFLSIVSTVVLFCLCSLIWYVVTCVFSDVIEFKKHDNESEYEKAERKWDNAWHCCWVKSVCAFTGSIVMTLIGMMLTLSGCPNFKDGIDIWNDCIPIALLGIGAFLTLVYGVKLASRSARDIKNTNRHKKKHLATWGIFSCIAFVSACVILFTASIDNNLIYNLVLSSALLMPIAEFFWFVSALRVKHDINKIKYM